MRMSITAEQIASIPGATNVLLRKIVGELKLFDGVTSTEGLLSKIIGMMTFDAYSWSRFHIQSMLDNNLTVEDMELYSPVMTNTQINVDVPDNWPGSQILDEEGNVVSRLTFAEYLRPTEVVGGTVLQFVGAPMDVNRNIILPSFAQLKVQIDLAGGFLTREEVDIIRIVTEEI